MDIVQFLNVPISSNTYAPEEDFDFTIHLIYPGKKYQQNSQP